MELVVGLGADHAYLGEPGRRRPVGALRPLAGQAVADLDLEFSVEDGAGWRATQSGKRVRPEGVDVLADAEMRVDVILADRLAAAEIGEAAWLPAASEAMAIATIRLLDR